MAVKELDDTVGAVVLDCVTLWVSNALLTIRERSWRIRWLS